MAFYDDEDENPQDPNAQAGPQATSAPSGEVGAGSGAAAAAAGSANAGETAPKAEPFVGISQYINANKPQSEKLAGQVVGNINQKAGAVDSALGEAQNSFNQAADAQKVEDKDDLIGQVKTNATGVAADQDKAGSFAKLRDATYSGPAGIENTDSWAGIQSALDKAKTAKDLSGTEEGRMNLIKEISNNPRQSQGALTFDNLLLQSNPNASGMLKNAGSSLNDIDARLGAAQTDSAAKAKAIADQNAALSASAKGTLSEGYSGLQNSLTQREANADAAQKAYVEQLKKSASGNSLDAQTLSKLGLAPNSQTYGANLGDYIDYVDQTDKYGVATQDDVLRQQALKALAGNSVDLGQDILTAGQQLGGAGPGYNFRSTDYQGAVDNSRNAYNSQVQGLQSQIDALNKSSNDAWSGGMSATEKAKARQQLQQQISNLTRLYGVNTTATSGQSPGALAGPAKLGV